MWSISTLLPMTTPTINIITTVNNTLALGRTKSKIRINRRVLISVIEECLFGSFLLIMAGAKFGWPFCVRSESRHISVYVSWKLRISRFTIKQTIGGAWFSLCLERSGYICEWEYVMFGWTFMTIYEVYQLIYEHFLYDDMTVGWPQQHHLC